jgi:hypothetical protein
MTQDPSSQAPARPNPGSTRGLALGLFGGPLAWGIQFAVGYGLTGYACFPHGHPLARMLPGLDWARAACLALNIAAMAAAAAVGWRGWRRWRATRDTAQYRTAFLAACGALTSFGFAIATLFDTVIILGAPACRG